jgi:hypothetical protein
MTRPERIKTITALCEQHLCNKEQRLRHYALFVDQGWNVHPSERFKRWWFKQDEFERSKDAEGNGTLAVTAMHCHDIWQAYLEAKEMGLA